MPRKSASSAIDSPAKRTRLVPRQNPYWHGIGGGRGGVSLGYRKPERGKSGSWVGKLVLDKRRAEERIGTADDAKAGADALSFSQAVTAALEWARRKREQFDVTAEGERSGADVTVRDAIDAYIADRKKRNKRTGGDAESRLTLHVLSDEAFARTRLAKLTARSIEGWRTRLEIHREKPLSPATINRLLNDVRAALNAAALVKRRELPGHVPLEIKVGTRAISDATEARRQVLADPDVRRIVDAAFDLDMEGDLGRLVLVLAATGARFSQVIRLTVADVQVEAQRIMMPASSKGRSVKARPRIAVPVGEDVLARLAPAINGRQGSEPLLERWRHKQMTPTEWVRDRRGAWTTASELTRPWAAILERAGLDASVIPYALRHSSIVRGLRAGLPTRMVAAIHDTSAAMIERHYGAFVLDITEELARRALVPLASPQPRNLQIVST
ncbi:MAG: integrase family protein [Xanthobacteraceae bacterium]|nr:MAG: integrase family protein [Xanthobacteraceae bacterium]